QKCVLMMWRRLFLYTMQTLHRLAAPWPPGPISDAGLRNGDPPHHREATANLKVGIGAPAAKAPLSILNKPRRAPAAATREGPGGPRRSDAESASAVCHR